MTMLVNARHTDESNICIMSLLVARTANRLIDSRNILILNYACRILYSIQYKRSQASNYIEWETTHTSIQINTKLANCMYKNWQETCNFRKIAIL